MLFIKALTHSLVRGAKASLKHIVLSVSCRLEIWKLDFLILVELVGSHKLGGSSSPLDTEWVQVTG